MATMNEVGVGLSGATGTGSFVGATSPTLTTPVIGQGTVTFTGVHSFNATLTADTAVTFPTSGTLATTALTGAVLLSPAGDQTISAHNLFLTAGGFITGSATGPVASAAGTIQAVGLSGASGSIYTASYINGAGSAPTFWSYKSRSTTVGSFTPVQNADTLGRWLVYGDDGTQFSQAASIVIQVSGSVSTGIVPAFMSFGTANTSGTIVTGLSIGPTQLVTVQNLFSNTNIQATGAIVSGLSTGASGGAFIAYSPTATSGSLRIIAADNGGNFISAITNTNMGQSSTITIPDPVSTTANFIISKAGATQHITSSNLQIDAGSISTGQSSGGANAGFIGYSQTASKGSINLLCADNSGNFGNTLTNASTGASRTWTLPDASGTIQLVGASLGAASATSITFSSTTGVVGTATNDNAAAGSVGEIISSQIVSGSAVSLTSTTNTDVTSISLTAGDWDIWGNVSYIPGVGTTVISMIGWISATSATVPDPSLYSAQFVGGAALTIDAGFTVPVQRISLSGTTTIYLSTVTSFAVSTLTVCGGIYARRRR